MNWLEYIVGIDIDSNWKIGTKKKQRSVVIPTMNCIFVLNTQNYSNLMMHKQFVVNQTLTHRHTRTFQLNHVESCMQRHSERKKRDICFFGSITLILFLTFPFRFDFVYYSKIVERATRDSNCVYYTHSNAMPQLFYYYFFLSVASSSFCSMNKHFGGRTEQK